MAGCILRLDEKPAQPLVTVVIPAYNAGNTIGATLSSVRSQEYSNSEIIVVDDGSIDATVAVVADHAAEDERIRLIVQTNAGVAAARNRGIAEARGDFVATIDADDLWSPDKLAKQVAVLVSGGERVGLVYTWSATIDGSGVVFRTDHRPVTAGKVSTELCRGNFIGNSSSPLMRRSALQAVGGYSSDPRARNAQGCEDWLLYYHLSLSSDFAVVPEFLTGYREWPESMSGDVFQMIRSSRIVAGEMRRKYGRFNSDVRLGQARTVHWLIGRSARANLTRQVVMLGLYVAVYHPAYCVRVLVPRLVRRARRLLDKRSSRSSEQLTRREGFVFPTDTWDHSATLVGRSKSTRAQVK